MFQYLGSSTRCARRKSMKSLLHTNPELAETENASRVLRAIHQFPCLEVLVDSIKAVLVCEVVWPAQTSECESFVTGVGKNAATKRGFGHTRRQLGAAPAGTRIGSKTDICSRVASNGHATTPGSAHDVIGVGDGLDVHRVLVFERQTLCVGLWPKLNAHYQRMRAVFHSIMHVWAITATALLSCLLQQLLDACACSCWTPMLP